jgi:hypothetical protein
MNKKLVLALLLAVNLRLNFEFLIMRHVYAVNLGLFFANRSDLFLIFYIYKSVFKKLTESKTASRADKAYCCAKTWLAAKTGPTCFSITTNAFALAHTQKPQFKN